TIPTFARVTKRHVTRPGHAGKRCSSNCRKSAVGSPRAIARNSSKCADKICGAPRSSSHSRLHWFRAMKILKFGGSSLATSDCIRDVARIVLEEARRGPVIVVLSAFQGVTNQLLDCARLAEKNDRRYDAAWT